MSERIKKVNEAHLGTIAALSRKEARPSNPVDSFSRRGSFSSSNRPNIAVDRKATGRKKKKGRGRENRWKGRGFPTSGNNTTSVLSGTLSEKEDRESRARKDEEDINSTRKSSRRASRLRREEQSSGRQP